MVALVWLMPVRYVNVSIQLAIICRIQSPYFSMYSSVDVCRLTSFAELVQPSLLWAYLLYGGPKWYQLHYNAAARLFQSFCLATQVTLTPEASIRRDSIVWFCEICITTSVRNIRHLSGQIYVTLVYGILQEAYNRHAQFWSKYIYIDIGNRKQKYVVSHGIQYISFTVLRNLILIV